MSERTSIAGGRKKADFQKIVMLLKSKAVFGVVNLDGLPASQQQTILGSLRGKVEFVMANRRVMSYAFKDVSTSSSSSTSSSLSSLSLIQPYLTGMCALLFTKENPFSLYKTIKKSKSPAYAKAGQTAPYDLIVKAGPTPFTPGPIISTLAGMGIKAGVEGGKVAVKQEAVVCKSGEKISAPVASLLQQLDVKPMEIGLNIVVVYENGVLYDRAVLDVDDEVYMSNLSLASQQALALAVECGVFTADTVETFIIKASREGREIVLASKYPANDFVGELLAIEQALSLNLGKELGVEVDSSSLNVSDADRERHNVELLAKDLHDKGTLRK